MLVESDSTIFYTLVLSMSQLCSRPSDCFMSSFSAALLKPSLLMDQALRCVLEDVHPLARGCVKFVPPENPLLCAAQNCWGTGTIDFMDFDASLDHWDRLINYVSEYTTIGKHDKKEYLTYLRTGLCAYCQSKTKTPMDKPQIDGLGRASQICERPPNGFSSTALLQAPIVIPQTAYRNLIDYLRFDPSFCNHAIPTFLPMGWVSLNFHRAPQDKPIDDDGMPYITINRQSLIQIRKPDALTMRTPKGRSKTSLDDKNKAGIAGEAEADTSASSTQDEFDLPMACIGSRGSWRRGWDGDLWYLGPRELRRQRKKIRNRANKARARK